MSLLQLSLPANLVARVWFSSGVFHPTPAEAIVVSFGGTTTNLFKANSIGTEETVMLQFGEWIHLLDSFSSH